MEITKILSHVTLSSKVFTACQSAIKTAWPSPFRHQLFAISTLGFDHLPLCLSLFFLSMEPDSKLLALFPTFSCSYYFQAQQITFSSCMIHTTMPKTSSFSMRQNTKLPSVCSCHASLIWSLEGNFIRSLKRRCFCIGYRLFCIINWVKLRTVKLESNRAAMRTYARARMKRWVARIYDFVMDSIWV